MIVVQQITKCGSALYQSGEAWFFRDMDTVHEYTNYVASGTEAKALHVSHERWPEVDAARGATLGGHGILIGWIDGNDDLIIESVFEIASVEKVPV